MIAAVAVDAPNEREQAARAVVEHHGYPVAILNVGSMHRHAQQQAKRIDENVALATRDLLGRGLINTQPQPHGAGWTNARYLAASLS